MTLRRLNQNEYDNTVRDLLTTSSRPARAFLSDTSANGFDNNGDLLSLSPTRLDHYRRAAETLADEALRPPLRSTLIGCDPAEGDPCLRTFLVTFGTRAYRRPIANDEVDRYLALAGKARALGAGPDEVLRTVLEAILISPHFLFRVEIDPEPTSLKPHRLAPYELASRLSYFLYGSMPDEPLFASAASGRLDDAKELVNQIDRMLADGKGRGMAGSFAQQWLGVSAIEANQPDQKLFPGWSSALAGSMRREVDLFFDELVRTNRPVAELLTARFSYLDGPLAKHYGLPAVTGSQRTDLDSSQRGGLLTMAAPLTATSRGNRTSPVERGRWTLSALLCSEPPAPPGDLQTPSEEVIAGASTQREFLRKHREAPVCASCHEQMDAIGLGLENFDAIGAWRDTDRNTPIDPTGSFADGRRFSGPRELASLIAQDPRFERCVANQLLGYAVGRTIRETDAPALAGIVEGMAAKGGGVRDLLVDIVLSAPFRMRRGEAAGKGGAP